jgi:nucleoside-diphosphate-sugar epimerase
VIAVTGGTGFIGRHLVAALLAEGRDVRVLTRSVDRARQMLPGAELHEADLGDEAGLRRALAGVHCVVHLAARLADGAPAASLEALNVAGTAALARAASAAGVERFIHGSSAGVYGDGYRPIPHTESDIPNPRTPYESSKLAAEAALRSALADGAVSWTIIRPTGVYGPGRPATLALYRDVATRRLWLHGPVRVLLHPSYLDDVVMGIRLVLDRDDLAGEIFNLGGERALPFQELIALVGAQMGHAPLQVSLPTALAWGRSSVVCRVADLSKARVRLGFTPVPLADGIARTAAWVRAQAAA